MPNKTIFHFIFSLLLTLFTLPTLAAEQLIIEPDMGRAPILSAMAQAKSSIDLVMYGCTDDILINALTHAKKTGKKIQVLLEPHPYKADGENNFAFHQFKDANITLLTPNPDVKLTHQKTLLTDHNHALIMTFNWTHSTFTKERNFALLIDNPAMIQEITHVFEADAQHKNIAVNNPDLVWSPNNSREKILDFIQNAKTEIKIYEQDISDYQTIGALAQAARAGKKVQLLLSTPQHPIRGKKLDYLKRAGVDIAFNKKYMIHAKVIMVDKDRAMLGSINLTRPSINDNRELAVITHDANTVKQLIKTFDDDWKQSTQST